VAGLGRKTWTNEVLAQPDLQGYLQDQTVMRFANAAARSAAIPAPTEGMLSYLDDQDRYEGYTGTVWTAVAWLAPQYVRGAANGTTDGSGVYTVTHGLGVQPAVVLLTPLGSAIQHLAKYVVTAISSTQFQVVMYNTTNGATIGGNPIAFGWVAHR
jgi:hypothetical protein